MRIVVLAAATEPVLEVLVVLVGLCWLFPSNLAPSLGVCIEAKRTGCHIGYSRSAAITYEVALVEKLHQCVFAMAGDGTGIAYGSWGVLLGG